MSTTLLGIMDGGCAEGGIPIEGVDAGILRLGAAYSKKHGPYYDPVASAARLRDPFPPFPIDFTLATVKPVTELLATLPIRCSTLGLYDIACIPVSTAPSSAPSIAFPASTLSQEVVLAIPMVATMTATMTDSSLSIDKRYESCISSESYLGPYSLQVGCAAPRHKAAHHVKLSHDAARKADKILQASNGIRNG
jgi:hypothetical protein